jgi:adenylosuccinate synthase
LDVDEVVLVIRAFPIRVGGNSGPLSREVDWKTLALESGCREDLVEYTSVTKTIRRVARFDHEIVRQAILVNKPTTAVLNHLDYVDAASRQLNALTFKSSAFVEDLEHRLQCQIDYFGFGPSSLVAREKRYDAGI